MIQSGWGCAELDGRQLLRPRSKPRAGNPLCTSGGTEGTEGRSGGRGVGGCWCEMPLRVEVSRVGGFVEVWRALHSLAAGAQDGLLFCRFMH